MMAAASSSASPPSMASSSASAIVHDASFAPTFVSDAESSTSRVAAPGEAAGASSAPASTAAASGNSQPSVRRKRKKKRSKGKARLEQVVMEQTQPTKGHVQVIRDGKPEHFFQRESQGASKGRATAISLDIDAVQSSKGKGRALVPFFPDPNAANFIPGVGSITLPTTNAWSTPRPQLPSWQKLLIDNKRSQTFSSFLTYDPTQEPAAQYVRGPRPGFGPALPPSHLYPTEPDTPNCLASRIFRPGQHFLHCLYQGSDTDEDHLQQYTSFLHAGQDRWKLVAATRSQIRSSRGCILAPRKLHAPMLRVLGLDGVHRLDKFAKYAGLHFNELDTPIVRLEDVKVVVEPDITRNGYCFMDGCGAISWALAKDLWEKTRSATLPRSTSGASYASSRFVPSDSSPFHCVPSVLQIRAPGVKGLVLVDPALEGRRLRLTESMRKLNVLSVEECVIEKGGEFDFATHLEKVAFSSHCKKALDQDFLHVSAIGHSIPQFCGLLNAQIVALLLERGVPRQVFEDLDKQYKHSVTYMTTDVWAAIDFLHLRPHPGVLKSLLTTLRLPRTDPTRSGALHRLHTRLQDLQASELARWKKKSKVEALPVITGETDLADLESLGGANNKLYRLHIPLREARRLYGVADQWGLLAADQVAVRYSRPDGSVGTVVGRVVVGRNPCYHPTDLVVLQAVDKPDLEFLRDVIVFSTKGSRPAADRCSGGDLDGDEYYVVWDEKIVSKITDSTEEFDYRPAKIKQIVEKAAARMGLGKFNTGSPENAFTHEPPPNKSNLVKALTTRTPPGKMIAKIDSTILALRQFKFPEELPPRRPDDPQPPPDPYASEGWTRATLLTALNALFTSSVDESVTSHLVDLNDALHRRIVSLRTPHRSELDKLLQECLRESDTAIEFQDHLRPHPASVRGFFDFSINEGGRAWADEAAMAQYVPPPRRDNIDLAVRVLRLADRESSGDDLDAGIVAGEVVDEYTRRVLDKFMPAELVARCMRVARDAEVAVQSLKRELLADTHPLQLLKAQYERTQEKLNVSRAMEVQMAQLGFSNELLAVSKRVLELEDKRLELKLKILDHMDDIEEIRAARSEYKKAAGRLAGLRTVVEGVRNALGGNVRSMDSKVIKDSEKILQQELEMFESGLPIYDSRNKLVEFMISHPVGLVLSATGSGKSTCVPHFLANELFFRNQLNWSKQIIVAQPRRQATLALAERLALTRQSLIGNEVGSHIGRSAARVTRYKTIINCVTYGIMLHYARRDPVLSGYSVVVLDEVHEDAADLYFLFGIVKKAMQKNTALRLLLMSAKVDSKRLVEYFGSCEVVEVSGRSHPIEEFFSEMAITYDESLLLDRIFDQISDIHTNNPLDSNPDILVFLPKTRLIDAAAEILSTALKTRLGKEDAANVHGFPLHAGVEDEVKRFVLKRGPVEQWELLKKMEEEAEKESEDGDEEEEEGPEGGNVLADDSFEGLADVFEQLCLYEPQPATVATLAKEESVLELGPDTFLGAWDGLDWADDVPEPAPVRPAGIPRHLLTKAERRAIKEEKEAKRQAKQQRNAAKEKRREKTAAGRMEALRKLLADMRQCNQDDGTRRVIFCTNIAETSLTIPKIGFVVDSGLQFSVRYRPTLNMQSCGVVPTTQVSAVQRKGRAGRLGPGKCYRMYSEDDARNFAEQTFSEPDQLDFMLLSIIEMYMTLDNFEWFSPPKPIDLTWTLEVLTTCAFLTSTDPARPEITPEGRIAMDLGRLHVPAQTARFLIDVWRSRAASSKLREHCVVLAAMQATRSARIFRQGFNYRRMVDSSENPFARPDDEEIEEIDCPYETLRSLPSSVCKINVYWMWRYRNSASQRAKFCKKWGLRAGDLEEVHRCYVDILKYMKSRRDLVAVNEWDMTDTYFDDEFPYSPNSFDSNDDQYYDLDDPETMFVDPHAVFTTPGTTAKALPPVTPVPTTTPEDDHITTDATSLESGAQIAFIIEHLVKAYPTNIAFLHNRRESGPSIALAATDDDDDSPVNVKSNIVYDCVFWLHDRMVH
ncbi:DEAH-box ATP-dependent RNA helicase prp43 [Phlyctochytrium bullatum]|nr:DEAH-box ATP-dependent RNA helicase prp43 [Phlyctochytrium bullatum]